MSVGSGAVIYARESDQMRHSLDDQVQKAKEYAKDNGFKVVSVIRETCSGKEIVKQAHLMNALLENKDTHFIFSHMDRITRDFQGFCSHFINCCNVNSNTIHIINEELVSSIPLHFKKIVCGIIDALKLNSEKCAISFGTSFGALSYLLGLTAFKKDGTVTAGNASGLNDGAAVLLIGSEEGCALAGKNPLSRILSAAVSGVAPRIMGIGPVEASKKALSRAGLSLDQMDIIEINEAFSAQVLACTRALGLSDKDPRINPNGGAISLGHPLGMTGARILLTASRQLKATGKRYALVTMCIGVGQGYATVLENAS